PEPEAIHQDYYKKLQEQLITAEPGSLIEIPAGTFEFDRPLSLDGIAGVTIKGAGIGKSILSFRGQKTGAEGLRITADSVTIQDLTVRDAKGDCIKIQDSKGVYLRNVETTWSGGAKETNGGYGLYPVSCTNVLLEGCEASFASDAGIYVGQSTNVIVRNCYAHENVAGIEIENCINAEVYGNRSEKNTGGILVFDMPDLPLVNGHTCKVYNNKIIENNHKNFAPEGNIVGIVPPGTGIILLAAKDVEIYDNEIIGHKTIGTAIASFQIAQKPWNDENYDPYTYNIYLHGNTYERGRALPDRSKDFGKLVNLLFFGKSQDILYDGITPEDKSGANPMGICIRETGEDLRFASIDAANDFDQVTKDMAPFDCNRESLPAVELN
ncbi:MAG: right-handed parallel beta-helix repeat-containing protein, partial [Phaeodactylibacter sp.]|nr:right-handed parallel beta-helix repeat-containing protein [Phaeodactylibacter sp.]